MTTLLGQVRAGDAGAADVLMDRVYAELRALAGAVMRSNPRHGTLAPTGLVHEVWMKLVGNLGGVKDRAHFFAIAAQAMRQVLADHAKAQRRLKRGGDGVRVTLFDAHAAEPETAVDLVAFHDCLERLGELNERHAKVVELRLLGSLTIEETATMLGVSAGTVKSDWSMARAWMLRELLGE